MSKNRARHPAARRHAEHGCGQDEADAGAGLARREIVAHDQCIARHDAALREAEQRRDDDRAKSGRRRAGRRTAQALQGRAEDGEGSRTADTVGDQARDQAADHAHAQHDRQHLGAARRRRNRGRRNRRRYGPAASTWRCSRQCRPRPGPIADRAGPWAAAHGSRLAADAGAAA